ncbi:hypothetical protein Hdeb2414_s0011g00371701 [Helianthus debilis subsp. tardiflorus]
MNGKYNCRWAFSLPSIFTNSLTHPNYCLQYYRSPKITTHTRPISKITTTYTTHPTFNLSCTRRTPTFNHHLHPWLRNHHHWSSSPTTHQHSKSVLTKFE